MGNVSRVIREETGPAYNLNKYTDKVLSRFIKKTASQVAVEKGIPLPVKTGVVLAKDRPSLKGHAKDYWRFPPGKRGIAFDYAAFRDVDVVLLLDIPGHREDFSDAAKMAFLPICTYWVSLIECCLKSMDSPQDIVLVVFLPPVVRDMLTLEQFTRRLCD